MAQTKSGAAARANEKRLIDANRAKRRIIAFATGCCSEVLTVDSIIMLLERQDTVDAVEVVHGRWIRHEEGKLWKKEYYECSNCGSRNPLHKFNYCFNCGANMDEE